MMNSSEKTIALARMVGNAKRVLGPVTILLAFMAVGFVATPPASAALVSGWGLETGATNGNLSEGAPGSFGISDVTGNAAPRALYPGIDFSDVGDIVRLSGFATFANSLGNQQFRFGIFDTNGNATGTLSGGNWAGADNTGWLGYFATPGNGPAGADALVGMNGGAWFSLFGGNYTLTTTPSTTSPAGGVEYEFTLTLERLSANDVEVSYSFVGGAENRSGSFVDSGGASTGLSTLDAVGFLTNSNTGASSFRDLDVSFIPEPSSLALVMMTSAGLLFRRKRKPSASS